VKWWVFALRFVVAAALALVLLGLLMKPYSHVLRWIVAGVLNSVAGFGVTESAVAESWYRSSLEFVVQEKAKSMPAGFVAINVTAFVALVGATPGLGWRRAIRSLAIGCAVFLGWHVIQISLLLVAGVTMNLAQPVGVARFLATISVVLPFALWLLLTRPPFVFEYFSGKQGDRNAEQT
jgi:hypothetical protein